MKSNRIAVVHDDPDTVRTLTGAFTDAGYEAVGALTFGEAVTLLGGCRPALLVVNLELGAYSGLRQALRAAAESPDVKIVVVGPSLGLEAESHAPGASAYVSQSPDALVAHARTMTVS